MKYCSCLYLLLCIFCLPDKTVQAAPPIQAILAGPWHGSYVCNQGLTRLKISIQPATAGGKVGASFYFEPDPDNPSVSRGSFSLTGTFDAASGRVLLRQDRWIEQPADPSYRMVDLEGKLTIGEHQALIRGMITTYGCQDFVVWQFFDEVAP
jgi:hypothetical protein